MSKEKKKPQTLVAAKSIAIASLHSALPWKRHGYAWPFVFVYSALLYFTMLTTILAIAFNALVYLACQWSVSVKAMLTCKTEVDAYKAALIRIIPVAHHGAGALCRLERSEFLTESGKKKKYRFDEEKKQFVKLRFPFSDGKPVSYFNGSRGLATGHQVKEALDTYGANKFDIPLPTFMELFQEHAVAPFFVFHFFCVALWFLDEMWYYSLFTLFMLFVFESTVVFQRLKSLQEFRSMSIKPYPILYGSCIANEAMLSGESTPQLKESIGVKDHRTKILQVTAPDTLSALAAPDGGCIAYVLRTGFSTQQGKLVRTIIFSTERITANNLESLLFILFLLVFAIAAAAYVWVEGTKNEERKRSKVLLDCILIITSVVPPELPMELSLAVNNSLIALARCYVDIACFDKTGTLTSENLLVEGVSGIGTDRKGVKKQTDLPVETSYVLAAAHALVLLEDGVIGDPMEKNTLEFTEWSLSKDNVVLPRKAGDKASLKILRRFQFSSALKRMSTISTLTSHGSSKLFISVKGAPETLRSMYKTLPSDYDDIYKYWARRGSRVLALGYRVMEGKKASDVMDFTRDEIESQLIFAGFLVFLCPLKPDSAEAIQMLNNSSHRCVMITGDNALTACHVAKEVSIMSRQALIADDRGEAGFNWRSIDESKTIETDINNPKFDAKLKGYDLCITGKGLAKIYSTPCFAALLPKLKVYARVSPGQKEDILTSLKLAGFCTLMCGDGTNDVGALKQAHVGIALLDGKKEDIEKINAIGLARRQKAMLEQQAQIRERFGLPPIPPPEPANPGAVAMSSMLSDMEVDVPTIKFGDASVAAPFTSKLSSVMSVCDIVRQGRSTLVAMVQMYKILALNCLISAYSMSVMYLAGIKQGDCNVFNYYLILSILGQVGIHVASLIYIRAQAIQYSEELDEEINLDAEFKPNLLNSAVYLVSLIMQISTFAINYQGEPFRESLVKNKALYNSIVAVGFIAVAAASEMSEGLNDWLQLVPFPGDFRYKLMATMAFDFAGAWIVEQVVSSLFSDNRPKSAFDDE
ncbi:hypothetical protein BC829DRAFT_424798 [Chytridium lagenaria]|nr:hypothetical protein BC829DRAFT_424798 [Chytridium lagenaria]